MLSESDHTVYSQVCLLPLILMISCQSTVKMSSMPTVARTWGYGPPHLCCGRGSLQADGQVRITLAQKSSWVVRGWKGECLPSWATFSVVILGLKCFGNQINVRFFLNHISSSLHRILMNLSLGLESSGSLDADEQHS